MVMLQTPKQKIAIVILEEFYARNFLNINVLGGLAQVHDLHLILADGIEIEESCVRLFSSVIRYDAEEIRKIRFYVLFNEVLRWRYRSRSKSFVYRESGLYPTIRKVIALNKFNKRQFSLGNPITAPTNLSDTRFLSRLHNDIILKAQQRLRWLFLIFARKNTIRVLSFNPFYFCFKIVANVNKVHAKKLESILLHIGINQIIFPTGGMRPADLELINIGKSNSITTFFIVENWDNLSSKTIFWKKPDVLGTWGPQSTKHAKEIQMFEKSQIFELGCSRFSRYRDNQIDIAADQLPINYVVFVGSIYPYDEFLALKLLDDEISENQAIYGNLAIIYRPYPGSTRSQLFTPELFQNVVLDPQMRLQNEEFSGTYPQGNGALYHGNYEPALSYFPKLINQSRFFVGGLSSMLIEASLFNKNYLAFAYNEEGCISSPFAILQGYTHFEEISSLHNLVFCNDIGMLKDVFRKCYSGDFPVNGDILQEELSYFVVTDVANFGQRLSAAVNQTKSSIP